MNQQSRDVPTPINNSQSFTRKNAILQLKALEANNEFDNNDADQAKRIHPLHKNFDPLCLNLRHETTTEIKGFCSQRQASQNVLKPQG